MPFPGSSESSERSSDLEAQSPIQTPSNDVNENTRKAIGDRTAFVLLKDNDINTTLVCATLNVQYDIKTTGKWFHRQQFTLITRTDAKNEKSLLVAELERNWINDRVRLPKSVSDGFMPTGDILRRVWTFPYFYQMWVELSPFILPYSLECLTRKLVFQANGKGYLWNSLPDSLKVSLSVFQVPISDDLIIYLTCSCIPKTIGTLVPSLPIAEVVRSAENEARSSHFRLYMITVCWMTLLVSYQSLLDT